MEGVNAQAKKDKAASEQKARTDVTKEKDDKEKDKRMLGRTDIDGEEAEDMQESYFRFMEERGEPVTGGNDEPEVEYDEDGNVIYTWKKVSELQLSLDGNVPQHTLPRTCINVSIGNFHQIMA